MRILLVYTNRYYSQFLSPPPIGLAYLVPPLKKRGHEVKVLNLMFSKNPKLELESMINKFSPQAVGFSIRNLDNQSMLEPYSPLPEIKEYVYIVKNNNIPTILGGTAFTTLPEIMLEYMNADYGIAGEGIKTFPDLIDGMAKGKLNVGIPGLVYRENGIIKSNQPLIEGYSEKLEIDWVSINIDQYRTNYMTPAVNIITKTGCPFHCNYCDTQTTFGNKFIFRNPKSIVEDIKEIHKNSGVKNFFLTDPSFNTPLDWAKDVLKEIIDSKLKISFMAILNPIKNSFDDELFSLYKKAGGFIIMAGYETFSQKMLSHYKKPFDIDDICCFNELAYKHRLKIGTELLFGGPGEDSGTIKESMGFLKKMKYSFLTYGLGIRILPNTEIFKIAMAEGVINDKKELLFSKYYLSKNLNFEWTVKYLKKNTGKYWHRSLGMLPILTRNLFGKTFGMKY